MRRTAWFDRWLGIVVLAAAGAGCQSSTPPNTDVLKIGAYSVVREVLEEGVLPAFQAEWKSRTGRDLEFQESYKGSGAQARDIAGGFDADVAILSHEGDMDVLVKAGRVKAGWNAGPSKGMITHSLVVIGHRDGNPKGIKDWADLARSGVGVLYPDPKTSGGARWNINAIYGAARLAGSEARGGEPDRNAVRDFLARVQANVINMDQSGRQSMANFAERGTGDAVVTYENEILLRNKESAPIPYVIPSRTLLIESPAAVVDSSVDAHGSRKVAEAFLEFLLSTQGQRILSQYGFRPVIDNVSPPAGSQPMPAKLFTMADLGGWDRIDQELYGPKGLWTSIFTADAGARTGR